MKTARDENPGRFLVRHRYPIHRSSSRFLEHCPRFRNSGSGRDDIIDNDDGFPPYLLVVLYCKRTAYILQAFRSVLYGYLSFRVLYLVKDTGFKNKGHLVFARQFFCQELGLVIPAFFVALFRERNRDNDVNMRGERQRKGVAEKGFFRQLLEESVVERFRDVGGNHSFVFVFERDDGGSNVRMRVFPQRKNAVAVKPSAGGQGNSPATRGAKTRALFPARDTARRKKSVQNSH